MSELGSDRDHVDCIRAFWTFMKLGFVRAWSWGADQYSSQTCGSFCGKPDDCISRRLHMNNGLRGGNEFKVGVGTYSAV